MFRYVHSVFYLPSQAHENRMARKLILLVNLENTQYPPPVGGLLLRLSHSLYNSSIHLCCNIEAKTVSREKLKTGGGFYYFSNILIYLYFLLTLFVLLKGQTQIRERISYKCKGFF